MANGVTKTVYLPESQVEEYATLGQQTERSFSYFVRRALDEYKGDGRVIKRRVAVNANKEKIS